jgi:hypothetical protein
VKQLRLICALAVFLGLCVFPGVVAGKDGVKPSFSLVIRQGFGSIGVGDLNDALNMQEAYYQSLLPSYSEPVVGGAAVTGAVRALGRGYSGAEAELRMSLGRFSLGLALTAPARMNDRSDLTYTGPGTEIATILKEIWSPEIRTDRPVQLTLYYSQPIIWRIKVVASGGIGYYRAKMKLREVWEYDYPRISYFGDYDLNVHGHGFGPHLGLGLECEIAKGVSLILDGQWRAAKIRTLTGTSTKTSNEYSIDGAISLSGTSYEGDLIYYYYSANEVGDYDRQVLCLEPEYPDLTTGQISSAHKAGLDLSGFSFKVGIKINLF